METGDLKQARAAAELAALAAPDEATPQLDLAAVAAREGLHGVAAEIARGVVSWRDGSGDGPVDLSDRAEAILRTHRWLEQASRASYRRRTTDVTTDVTTTGRWPAIPRNACPFPGPDPVVNPSLQVT